MRFCVQSSKALGQKQCTRVWIWPGKRPGFRSQSHAFENFDYVHCLRQVTSRCNKLERKGESCTNQPCVKIKGAGDLHIQHDCNDVLTEQMNDTYN